MINWFVDSKNPRRATCSGKHIDEHLEREARIVARAMGLENPRRAIGGYQPLPAHVAPPRPEVCATLAGIDRMFEDHKSFLKRQVVMRGLVISPTNLVRMENEMRNNMVEMMLAAADRGKSKTGAPGDE